MRRLTILATALVLAACSDEAPTAPQQVGASALPKAPTAAPAVAYATLTGDAVAGEQVFARCRSCHVIQPGLNRVGPSLHRIVGKAAGTEPGFRYSKANQDSDLIWSEETLYAYLENPRRFMPGTTMSFAGLRDPQQRADVIAYLKANAG